MAPGIKRSWGILLLVWNLAGVLAWMQYGVLVASLAEYVRSPEEAWPDAFVFEHRLIADTGTYELSAAFLARVPSFWECAVLLAHTAVLAAALRHGTRGSPRRWRHAGWLCAPMLLAPALSYTLYRLA